MIRPSGGACSAQTGGTLDGIDGALGVQVTPSLEDMDSGHSSYGEILTDETILWFLLKNTSHDGCLILKQDDFIITVLIDYE